MIFDLKTALNKISDAVEVLAPIAKAYGGDLVTKVTDLVTIGLDIAENIHTRVDETKSVLASNDVEEIRAITDKLSAINDELMEYVKNS